MGASILVQTHVLLTVKGKVVGGQQDDREYNVGLIRLLTVITGTYSDRFLTESMGIGPGYL